MKKSEFLFLCIVFCTLFVFQVTNAQVSSFSFITKPQAVLPNILSKEITVQSLNTNNVPENVPETFDLNFTSTSHTGEFLGSTGKPVSKTMNKNTGKRTFYYKDSTEGDFVITVTATGRDSKKSFTTKQNIKIGKVPDLVKPTIKTAVARTIEISPEKEVSTTTQEIINEVIFTAPRQKGFFHRIFSWPISTYNFIARFFVES